jgi:hypothetical protein
LDAAAGVLAALISKTDRRASRKANMSFPGKDQASDRISKFRLRRFFSKKIVLLPACLLLVALGLLFWNPLESPFENDPNFVKTTRPTTSFTGPGATLRSRFYWKYNEWKRMRHPNPLAYKFPARSRPERCSIDGLLNQCMEVGGTQYLIEKNVAAGSVEFGSTNTLNGQQWITAFEDALKNGVSEWWDPEKKGIRRESLVLIRYDSRTTLVFSKKLAAEYQKRYPGLKW